MTSKKGACSAHIETAKANCLQHVRRDYSERTQPHYIFSHLTERNITVYENEAIRGRKSILPLITDARRLYTQKTGQKCQKSFAPFREDVLSLPGRGDITREQLMAYKAKVEAATGWQCMGMWYHKDEGYVKSKHIEGSEGEAINYHVHCLWNCQDPATGKARRNDRQFFRLRQDWLAAATGMERGNPAPLTGREHRDATQQRFYAEEQRIDQLMEAQKNLREENEQLRLANAMKEKILGAFRQSAKDKQIKQLLQANADQAKAMERLQRDLKAKTESYAADLPKQRQEAADEAIRALAVSAGLSPQTTSGQLTQILKEVGEGQAAKKSMADLLKVLDGIWIGVKAAVETLISRSRYGDRYDIYDLRAIDKAIGNLPGEDRNAKGWALYDIFAAVGGRHDKQTQAVIANIADGKVDLREPAIAPTVKPERQQQIHRGGGRGR